ncbi:MAG: glycosyl-4,4'-diaponeurosporenoate acyltransferase [Clostridia bacterium]|nr:glycosyl-4,4'-diaponeurosporenoate acyltransferase [Clostridia bacterium]
MGFIGCFVYLFFLGILSFFVGRIIPKKWIDPSKFPFKEFRFENGGKLYEKLNIKKWQNKLPDMSKIFPKLISPKRITEKANIEMLQNMLHETCVAEMTHVLLPLAALPCLLLWRGIKGKIIYFIYVVLGNLPYIVIQRYNRPRLKMLLERVRETGV